MAAFLKAGLWTKEKTGKGQLDLGTLISTVVPTYVPDVLPFPNFNSFPIVGETNKIYIDQNSFDIYIYTGQEYIQLKGDPGVNGINGSNGINGTNGTNGINGIDGSSTNPLLGLITPSSIPTGIGAAYWIAVQGGTYTSFGNLVVNTNSFAVISRDDSGSFSISQTTLDISSKLNVSDVVNTLISTDSTKPLSAAQGKVLNEKFNLYASDAEVAIIQSNINTTIAAVASGSPKGVYVNLTALQTAFPTGDLNIYITLDNGHWNYYNGGWQDGGLYQSPLTATVKTNETLAFAQRKGDTLYNILDQYTGEQVTLLKTTGTPIVDNVIYFKLGTEYFKRVGSETINLKWFGSTILTQSMFAYANTTYIVDKDYTLNNTSITIPLNSTIEFQGGGISNGTLNFLTGCKIANQKINVIFNEVIIKGYLNCEIRSSYFNNLSDDILFNNLVKFRIAYLEKSIFLGTIYSGESSSMRSITHSFDLIGIGNVTISTRNSLFGTTAVDSGIASTGNNTIITGQLTNPNDSVRFVNLNFFDIEYDQITTTPTYNNSLQIIGFGSSIGVNSSLFLENCNFKTVGSNVGFGSAASNTSKSFYAKNCKFESLIWPTLAMYNQKSSSGIKEAIIDNCEIRNGVTFVNKYTDNTHKCKVEFKNCVTNGWYEITTPDNLDNLNIYFNNCKSNDIDNPFMPQNTAVLTEAALPSGNVIIDQCQFEYIGNICNGYKNVTIQNTNINLSKVSTMSLIKGDLKFKNVKLDRSDSSAYLNLNIVGNYYFDNLEEIISGNLNKATKASIIKINKGVVKDLFNVKSSIRYLTTDFFIGDNLLSFNAPSNNCVPIILNDIDSCDNGIPYSISNGCLFGSKTIPFTSTTNSNVLIIDFDINVTTNCSSTTPAVAVYFQNKTDTLSAIRYGVTVNSKTNLKINNRAYLELGSKDLMPIGIQHCRVYFSTSMVYVDINKNPIIFYNPDLSYSPINLSDFNLIISNDNPQIDINNINILQL